MTDGRTAKHATARELLSLISNYLRQYGIAGRVSDLATHGIDPSAFEDWILALLATFFYQVHRCPSTIVPGFQIRGRHPNEQKVAKLFHQIYVRKFFSLGWLIRDRTGLIIVHDIIGSKIEAWTKVKRHS